MDLIQLLERWVEITGVDPNDKQIRLKDIDIIRANRIIKKSLEVDQTYVTTLMLLDSYLTDFVKDRTLTLHEIMSNYEKFSNWLGMINDFRASIRSDEAMEIREKFKASLKEAIAHYKVHPDVIEKIVENDDLLAELRYSSFNAISTLEIAQFSHGEPSDKKPVLYQDVYRFSDINALLSWMMNVESGIVMAMIQDTEDDSNTYFVFAIRNGGTMTILTDRERTAHPLETQMSRSRARGRAFNERIESYYFPYDSLMDIQFGDNDRAYVRPQEETSLATRQDGIPIRPINLLGPDEIVWVIMVFSHLNEKFFKENYKTKELSYTPKMMMETDYLLKEAEEKGIVLYGYQGIEVPKLTKENMRTENVKNQFAYEPSNKNDWLIERYPVSDSLFDVLPNENETLMLTDGSGNDVQSLTLSKMNPSYFGDEERLTKDRIYMARYNLARAINIQVQKEYSERKEEVLDWYEKAVRKNLPTLLEAMAKGRFLVDDKDSATLRAGGWSMRQSDGNILYMFDRKKDSYTFGMQNTRFMGRSSVYGKYTCALNDTAASFIGQFHPTNASMLANLCGCDVSELHELLQHWQSHKGPSGYSGNPILSRVDPMEWKIKNPWEELNLDVRVYLSKSGYNALCKEHGFDKDMFWLKEDAYEKAKVSYLD